MTFEEFESIIKRGDICNLFRFFKNGLGDEIISEMQYCGLYGENTDLLNFSSGDKIFHILISLSVITDVGFDKIMENRKCVWFVD